jgi:hypothetical protein
MLSNTPNEIWSLQQKLILCMFMQPIDVEMCVSKYKQRDLWEKRLAGAGLSMQRGCF